MDILAKKEENLNIIKMSPFSIKLIAAISNATEQARIIKVSLGQDYEEQNDDNKDEIILIKALTIMEKLIDFN